MSRVTVVAARAFEHQGRTFVIGDAVEVDAIQAAALARHGYVNLDRSARPIYQTRDMTAAPVLSGHVAPVEDDPAPPKRRRGRPPKKKDPPQ